MVPQFLIHCILPPHPDKDASDAKDKSVAGKMNGKPDIKSTSKIHHYRSLRASSDKVKNSLDLTHSYEFSRRPSGRFKRI